MKLDKDKILFFHIPLLCQILSLYNRILIYFGLKYLYLPVYIIGLTLLLFSKRKNKYVSKQAVALAYLALVLLLGFIHLIGTESVEVTILGSMVYILPLLYWTFYASLNISYFRDIVYGLRIHVLILCVFAIVQYFMSPTLWGLLAEGEDMIQWASKSDFSDYSQFLRATSYLSSSQALGMFVGLFFVIYHYLFKVDKFAIILYLFIFIAGVISGCKSFYMIVLVYTLYRFFSSGNIKVAFGILVGVLAFVFILSHFKEEFGFVARLFDLDKLVSDEKEGRLSVYSYFLSRSTLFGNGPGVIQNIAGVSSDKVAESYIIQMIYELGYFAFLMFLLFLSNCYYTSKARVLILVVFFSTCVVHVFNGFFMFIFWGVFFYKRKNQVINNTHLDIYR